MVSVTHLTNQSQFVQANAGFNGTNISGTIASNGISLSVAPGGGGADGYNILAAGTQTANTTGTVAFSNSNGITFGMSNNSIITASHNGLTTAALSNHSHNFATTTTNGSLIVVGTTNSNGATIGVPAFLTTAQAPGAYLTTARASNDAIGLNSAFTAGPLAMTINSSGLSLNASNAAGTTSGFAGNLISGSMTHNTAGLNLSLNHPAWLTTAALSDHSHGNPSLALTNLSGTTASNSAGLTLSLSAAAPGGGGAAISGGANSQSTGTVNFANSNGITFGLSNNGTMTASHNGLTTQSAQAFSADASSTFQTLVFQDSNGVSFSNNAGSLRVTHGLQFTSNTSAITSNALHTSSPRINVSAGTTSNNLSAITFSNSNGMSFGLNGSVVTGSYTVPTVTNSSWTVLVSNTSSTVGSLRFENSNGVSFGIANTNGSIQVTASHNGLTTAAQSNHSHGNPQLNLTNLSGTTASNSAGFTLSLSAAAPGAGGGIALANSQTTYTSGTAHLSVVGGAMTIASTTGQSFNFSVPAVSSIVGVGGITVSTNGSTVSISNSAQNPTISAGTTSHAVNSINFSNANGVSFGMGTGASSTVVTASVAGAGARTVSTYVPFGPFSTSSQTLGALGASSGSARFFPIFISDNIAFNALRVMHSLSYATSSVSGQQSITYGFGLFSNNAGTLSSISSNSFSFAVTNSSVSNTVSYPASTNTAGYTYTTLAATTTAQIQSLWGTAGGRPIDLVFGNSMTLSSGMYWLGVNLRHSSSSANIGISVALAGNANQLFNNVAPWGVATSAQTTNSAYRDPYRGLGAYTVSQSSLPNGVPLTQIAHTQTVLPLVSFLST